jgi:hypothetical protein
MSDLTSTDLDAIAALVQLEQEVISLKAEKGYTSQP